MVLTANTPLTIIRGEQSEASVASGVTIYEGAILGLNSTGYARGLVAGDKFYGHSMEFVDNSLGDDGVRTVQRIRGRYRLEVTLTGVAITDVGKEVFASADDTLTFSSGDNTKVGVVERYATTNTAIVEFQTSEEVEEGIESVEVIGGAGGILALNLVYVSDQTAGIMTVLKAQGTSAGRFADYICPKAIAAAAKGLALKHYLLQGIDTSAAGAVGDPVYLSDAAAGVYTLTKPTATDKVQIVGRVVEKHATTGAILFDLSGPQQVVHDHSSEAEGGAALGDHSSGTITLGDGKNIAANATTGSKIGTAANQKIGFWNATPAVQQLHIADPAACAGMTLSAYTAPTNLTDPPTKSEVEAQLALIDAALDQVIVDVAALKTAIDANNATLDSILAQLAALGLQAAS